MQSSNLNATQSQLLSKAFAIIKTDSKMKKISENNILVLPYNCPYLNIFLLVEESSVDGLRIETE